MKLIRTFGIFAAATVILSQSACNFGDVKGFFSKVTQSTPAAVEPPPPPIPSTELGWLNGEWTEMGGDANNFKLSITNGNRFSKEVILQVGDAKDEEVPFNTICHFKLLGNLVVSKPSQQDKENYKNYKRPTPDFTLALNVEKEELLPGKNPPACAIYIKRMNAQVPLHYSMLIVKTDDNTIQDAWDLKKYQRK